MIDLRLGDCLDVMAGMEPNSVDTIITDPPYGIGLSNHDKGGARRSAAYAITGDKDRTVGLAVIKWSERHDLPIVVFASPWWPWPGQWRNLIVWDKGGAVGGGGDTKTCLKRSWELIQVARNGPLHNGRSESVWRYPITPQDTIDHIAAKPVALMCELITKFTDPGTTVFDPCMGSGSTGIACIQTGRNFIGIEIDPDRFAIAEKRIAEAQKQPILAGL